MKKKTPKPCDDCGHVHRKLPIEPDRCNYPKWFEDGWGWAWCQCVKRHEANRRAGRLLGV